jgi:hypothetical protein
MLASDQCGRSAVSALEPHDDGKNAQVPMQIRLPTLTETIAMKRHVLLSFALAGLAACETPPSAPTPRQPAVTEPLFAVVVNEQKLPFAFPVINPCNGEVVPLAGEFHVVVRETQDASGGIHFGFRLSAHGEGVGTITGVTYVWNDVFGDHVNISESFPDGSANTTFTSSTLLIAKGRVPNFQLKALFHITFNANGEVTSLKSEFSPECRG